MITHESYLLAITAVSIGIFHTLLGPDHYVPFIVLARARGWPAIKTATITFLCGLGHVGSSIVIGTIGIAFGKAVSKLVGIESVRGEIAAWLMIAFGFSYMLWGIRKSVKQKSHSHLHMHPDGTVNNHTHKHQDDHLHFHKKKDFSELTPWLLFTIFVFGPCEPFIPILLYPAAQSHLFDMVLVSVVFTIATTGTMIAVVLTSLYGFRFIPKINIERHMHAIAGGTILMCGIGIRFLGL
jgi:nickel/cobalt transporter (NicO) family protein